MFAKPHTYDENINPDIQPVIFTILTENAKLLISKVIILGHQTRIKPIT